MKAPGKRRRGQKIAGGFVALPNTIIDSQEYRALPFTAKALLIDMLRAYNGRNNGSLTMVRKRMEDLCWVSHATLTRARNALLKSGLLVETRMGARPNKAAWYAIGWHDLDATSGLDINPSLYRRFRPTFVGPVIGLAKPATGPHARPRASSTSPDSRPMEDYSAIPLAQIQGRYIDLCQLPKQPANTDNEEVAR